MRHQQQRAAAAPFLECDAAALGEAGIAHCDHLIHQITVKIDRHAQAKGQARAHPGRIGLHRHAVIFAQFGEFLDEALHPAGRLAIDPGNEAGIIRTRDRAMHRTAKTQRPGDAHATNNLAAARRFNAGKNANKCGFSGPIAPQNPHRIALPEGRVHVAQHRPLGAMRVVEFAEVAQLQHGRPSPHRVHCSAICRRPARIAISPMTLAMAMLART